MRKLLAELKRSPVRYSFASALFYFLLASTWITLSSSIASRLAGSVEDLQRIETIKGLSFVFLTSGLFFLFSLSVYRRMNMAAEESVRVQQRLAVSERESALGLIASSFAHDLNNILTVLRVGTERLANSSEMPDSLQPSLTRVRGSIDRMAEMAERMQHAGRGLLREGPQAFDLEAAAEETIDFLRMHRSVQGCVLEFASEGAIASIGYPTLIHQILVNLIVNAAEATEGHGRILVLLRSQGGTAVLEVHDNGPGVPAQLRESIFEAFFTTKRFGTGLGLVSVRSCLDILGGKITVGESKLGGAAIIAELPVIEKASPKENYKVTESLNKNRSLRDAPSLF